MRQQLPPNAMTLLLLALTFGQFDDARLPEGMVRYGSTLYPEGTLERIRTFKDGKESTEGILVSLNGETANIHVIKTRLVVQVPLKRLSPADRTWIKKLAADDKRLKRPPWKPE